MKIHHLNCGSMRVPTAPLVCHVLLVESDQGLVLVDTGFGLLDCADPRKRLGLLRHPLWPVLDTAETAARQIESLGFRRADVRHIVLTHFDLDHIGGIADFPAAQVHVTSAEAMGAVHAPSRRERIRYRHQQWAHGPQLVEHDPGGEPWRGFASAKQLFDGIVFISLPGHSRGHACIAVDAGHRWVLHAGDAFYHHGTLEGRPIPRVLATSETMLAFDRKQVRDNHARLIEVAADPNLLVISAHDPELLVRARATN